MQVPVDHGVIRCDVLGEGEPLLWVHGYLGSGPDWVHVLGTRPDGIQLIAPDLRGHGASSPITGEFTFRQAARDLQAVLRHIGVRQVKAIGISGGGIALMHLALMDPASIGSMVLVSAPPYFPEQARAIQRQASTAMFPEEEMRRMRARHVGGEAQVQQLLAQARGFAESYDDVCFTPAHLARIEAHTLIVFGDRDPLYPVSLAFELYGAMRRAALWIVPEGGHSPVFGDRAQTFAQTALEFLRRRP
jgi:pimeloyl-ACP methyl ester carboxylesterase